MAEILFLTQVLPYPLDSGARVRQYHMLRHLSKRHQVTLVSFVRPDDKASSVEHLREICHAVCPVLMQRSMLRNGWAAVKGLFTGLPMVVTRDEIGEMAATLRNLTQATSFDLIHADQLSMAGYGQLAARISQPHRPRTLLDEHNAIYLLVRRMANTEPNRLRRLVTAREARAFARYEQDMCRAYDALLTVTRQDQEFLLDLFPEHERQHMADKFTTVPICVDPEEAIPVAQRNEDAPTILHLGTMFWPPNIAGVLWFAREVLPLIHQQEPRARFVIVGKNPPPEVQDLAADSRISVTGYVADPMPYLQTADAFVVPLHAAGGMRVKILDAWLWGLPVVSTTIGAEGIMIGAGDNILIAEDAYAFAQATLSLLINRDLNQKLRVRGRAWVESKYAWQVVYQQVDKVYDRLLSTVSGVHKTASVRLKETF